VAEEIGKKKNGEPKLQNILKPVYTTRKGLVERIKTTYEDMAYHRWIHHMSRHQEQVLFVEVSKSKLKDISHILLSIHLVIAVRSDLQWNEDNNSENRFCCSSEAASVIHHDMRMANDGAAKCRFGCIAR